jgi:hypothetical protein
MNTTTATAVLASSFTQLFRLSQVSWLFPNCSCRGFEGQALAGWKKSSESCAL